MRTLSILVVGSCLAAMGCIAGADEANPFDSVDLEVPFETTGFGVTDGLLPSVFWHHSTQARFRSLAPVPLADPDGNMPNLPLPPPSSLIPIKHAVECALLPSQWVKNPYTGEIYEGLVGLAPEWRHAPLSAKGRKWVTACLLQRLNATGVTRPILMEGNHPSLSYDPAQDALYPFDESSAYGDLFSSTVPLGGNNPAFTAHVCVESDLFNQCSGGLAEITARICDTAGVFCGLHVLGPCSTACVNGSGYWVCGGFQETIRVKLQTGLCL